MKYVVLISNKESKSVLVPSYENERGFYEDEIDFITDTSLRVFDESDVDGILMYCISHHISDSEWDAFVSALKAYLKTTDIEFEHNIKVSSNLYQHVKIVVVQ